MSTSFLAHRMETRRGVVREVRNPVHNGVSRGRGEAANIFKIGEELHKSQRVSPRGRRTEKADKCRKDFWMLKTRYQKWRRFRKMYKIIKVREVDMGWEEETEIEVDGGAEVERGR